MEDSARTHDSISGDDTLALRELLTWVQSKGGSADKLQLATESCARKLVAKSNICGTVGEGDTIFSIPTSCLLHPDSAKTDYIYGPAFTSLSLEPGVDDRTILTLFLALERERGESSKWAPYIKALPAHIPVPLSWSDSELRHLEGTRLEHAVKQHSKALRQEIEVWAPSLLAHIQHKESNSVSAGAQALAERALNAEQISWSRSCVWSRAFSLYLNQTKTIALVPLGDMLDHSPDVRVEWLTDDTAGTFSIRSYEAISSGGEVFNNYGQKGNEELLLGYAFVLEQNKADTFHIELAASETLEPSDLQGSSNSVRECRTHNLLLSHYGVNSTHYLRVDDPLPESLLLAAKIFSSSPALAYRLCSEVPTGKSPEEALATHMPSDDLCTSLRALRSLHLLITGELKRLNRRGTSVESGCIEDERGFSARMSSVYRKSQTRIANMTLTAISLRVKSLLSDLRASVERHSRSDSDELYSKEKQAYLSWLSECGVQNSAVEEVSIRHCFGFTDGLRVTSLIAEGSFIGGVPVDALLVTSDVFRELCSKFGKDAEQAALAATLLQSTLNGKEHDSFAPFVNWIMCAPVTAAAFNSDVLTVLQGTAVGQDAIGLRSEYDKEFETLKTADCFRSNKTQVNLSSLYARVRTLVERYAVRLPEFEREDRIPVAGRLALAPSIGFFPKALEDIAASLVWTLKKTPLPTCEGKWHLELKSLCEMDPGTLLIEPTDGMDEGTQILEIGTESLCSLVRECGENNWPSTSMPITTMSKEVNCLRFTSCHSVELLLEPADEDENLRRSKFALLRFMGVGDSHYLSMVPNPEILCVALSVCSAENEAEVETLRTAWLTAVKNCSSERQIEDPEVLQANRTDLSSCGAVMRSDDRTSAEGKKKKNSSVESETMFQNPAESHDTSSGIHFCTFQLAAKTLQLNRGVSMNIKKVARTMLRSMVQQLPIPSSDDVDIEKYIRLGTRLEREASLQRAVALRYVVRQREILEKNVEALVRRHDTKALKKRPRS